MCSAVGHGRSRKVSNNHIQLLPWRTRHHHCLRCYRSGLRISSLCLATNATASTSVALTHSYSLPLQRTPWTCEDNAMTRETNTWVTWKCRTGKVEEVMSVVFQSCIFQPCILVDHFLVLHFQCPFDTRHFYLGHYLREILQQLAWPLLRYHILQWGHQLWLS